MITFRQCLIFFTLLSTFHIVIGLDAEQYAKDGRGNVLEFDERNMVKRAAVSLIKSLLKTATVKNMSKHTGIYEKKGDFDVAMKDFQKLKPTDVKKRRDATWGKVGDRTVILKSKEGKTTLYIWRTIIGPMRIRDFVADQIDYIN